MGSPGSEKARGRTHRARQGVPVIATGDMLRRTALAPTPLGRGGSSWTGADRRRGHDRDQSERIVPPTRSGLVLDGFQASQPGSADVLRKPWAISPSVSVPQGTDPRLGRRLVCHRCGAIANCWKHSVLPLRRRLSAAHRRPGCRRARSAADLHGRPNLFVDFYASAPHASSTDVAPDRVAASRGRSTPRSTTFPPGDRVARHSGR
jgi:hypothetical protein